MAITVTTAMCDSFKKEVMMGGHYFRASGGHTFKMCLLKATASGSGTYGTANTNYGSGSGSPTTSNVGTDEATDTGGNSRYTAGGFTMTANADPSISNNVAFVDWNTDPNWGTDATITSYGAVLYNSSTTIASVRDQGATVGCFAFGADKTCTTGTFTVTLPAAASGTAIVRI